MATTTKTTKGASKTTKTTSKTKKTTKATEEIEVKFKVTEKSDGELYQMFQEIGLGARSAFIREALLSHFRLIRDRKVESNYLKAKDLRKYGSGGVQQRNAMVSVDDLLDILKSTMVQPVMATQMPQMVIPQQPTNPSVYANQEEIFEDDVEEEILDEELEEEIEEEEEEFVSDVKLDFGF